MSNRDLARIFSEIADLLDISGEDGFRVNSYRRTARTIEDLTAEAADLDRQGTLAELPGVGKATVEKIRQFLTTGRVDLHQELLAAVPAGLPPLLAIPGFGPKKVALVWRELKVECLDDLKRVIESGELAKLRGMGAKTVDNIREGIQFLARSSGRTPLGLAWPLGLELAEAVRGIKGAQRVELAGSLRRSAETIGDIDLVCAAEDGAAVVQAFTKLPLAARVVSAGESKGSIVARCRDGSEVRAQLRVVPPESFGAALQYFTGSKEHNVRVRELAAKRGWKLNEWGLFDGDTWLAGADEAEIYARLGLPLFPPELREDRGELEAAADLPKLIERSDIKGDLHMHTSASDGTLTAAEMIAAAAAIGHQYVAITDHSKSSVIANGLSLDRMWRQIEKVRGLNQKHETISVLVGCECDILPDGKLDYPDSILAACDIVVASVHGSMKQDRETITRRVIKAMENPFVTIIGHPTGRLINKRDAMDLDMEAVIAAAARTGTALELNASWQRLDLHDRHARAARDAGVMLTIDTDAHAPVQFEQMDFGVRLARRAWLRAEDVLNTRPLYQVKRWIAKKRKAAQRDKSRSGMLI